MIAGNFNTGVGEGVFEYTADGDRNTAMGQYAMVNGSGANDSAALGFQSASSVTGSGNTALGFRAASGLTSGTNNVAVGFAASDTETGANANATGSNNVFVGAEAGPGTPAQISNAIALGYQAHPSASNRAVIGNGAVTDVYFGSESGLARLHAANIGTNSSADAPVRFLTWSCSDSALGGSSHDVNTVCGGTAHGQVLTRACTLQRLWVHLDTPGANSSNAAVTVQRNQTATTIGCAGGTATTCSDSGHSIRAAAGDLIWIKTLAGSTRGKTYTVSIECQ
jgi:hypothetical protein